MTDSPNNLFHQLGKITHSDPFRITDVLQMFTQVFHVHSPEEVESQFAVGLAGSPSKTDDRHNRVAKPWFFSRVLLFFLIAYVMLSTTYNIFPNPNLIPGMILIGSFAGPIATAIFFFECNLCANISLYMILRMFTWGGILGIVLSLTGFWISDFLPMGWMGASVAALIEEPGKLAAVIFLASRQKYPWILNGLCLGAAVGAGFAAFESAGYAFSYFLLSENSIEAARSNLWLRGIISPWAHTVWTAITAGAFWRVIHDRPFSFSYIADWRFMSPYVAVTFLHFFWNSSLLENIPFLGKYVILGVIAWTFAFSLIFTGFREVREVQKSS